MSKGPVKRIIRIEYYIGTTVFLISIALWAYGRFRPQPELRPTLTTTGEVSIPNPKPSPEFEPVRPSRKTSGIQPQATVHPPEEQHNPYDPEQDARLRGERISNFTVFQDKLVQSLGDGYSESFARDLSYALIKALHEGRGNEEGVRDTIAKVLGKDSTPEKVDEIHKGFQRAVSSAGESLPPPEPVNP